MTDNERVARLESLVDDRFGRMQAQVDNLANRSQAMEIAVTRIESDKAHFDRRFDDVIKSVESSKQTATRIVWLVATGIIGAFVKFIVEGGLIQ